ncbi:Hypothetical predicted protein [Marmota monax]|uniref:Uncharacterized protein n=1 Tax=Marmota monax TaxID=9995 RepID=A0A5E4CDD5_MARMO|nr:Hypothetical predicted protein [Marmota monax]
MASTRHGSQHSHVLRGPPGCPRGRSAPPKARRRRSPSGGRPACRLSLLLPRRTPSLGRRRARINHQTKKVWKAHRSGPWTQRRSFPSQQIGGPVGIQEMRQAVPDYSQVVAFQPTLSLLQAQLPCLAAPVSLAPVPE